MKILIVDDSRFSQITNSKYIKKLDELAEIEMASNGEDGFKKYKDFKPDYVLVDLLMPKVNGQELIKYIKEYDRDAKIIVITADVQKSIREELESWGIKGFINKPLNEEKAKILFGIIKDGN